MLKIHIYCQGAVVTSLIMLTFAAVFRNKLWDRALSRCQKVMKKFIVLLLFLSSMGFAMGPVRHRVALSNPDVVVNQLPIQRMMSDLASVPPPQGLLAVKASFPNHICATIAQDLVSAAKNHIGARYSRGSSGPTAFDCSGFTSYVFERLGISLKRSSQEQHEQGAAIDNISEMLPGDLVFFGRGGKRVNHVGIVTSVDAQQGTFSFIHASTSRGVRIDSSTDAYWTQRFINARRIIGMD